MRLFRPSRRVRWRYNATMSKALPQSDLKDASKAGLDAALGEANGQFRAALEALSAERFFVRPEPSAWSAAEHARHLITSVNAVAKGLTYPKWVIRLRFGKSRGSRAYGEVVADYQARLASGGRASGRFVPPSEVPAAGDQAEEQRRLVERWQRACGRLATGLESWTERDLDRLSFPHPLLGKLTVREMLLFTRYHNLHHALRVEEMAVADPGHRDSYGDS